MKNRLSFTKRITLALAAGTIAMLMFASCSNLPGSSKNKANSKTYVTVAFNDRKSVPVTDVDSFKKFTLVAEPVSDGADTVTWDSYNSSNTAYAQLLEAKISVVAGKIYNFTLIGTTNGGASYKGVSKNVEIQTGANELCFSMEITGLGTKKGTAEIGMNVPESVTKITVSVFRTNELFIAEDSPVSTELTNKEIEIADGKALFSSGELNPGYYCAEFSLWAGEQKNALVATWYEYFAIAGGAVTKGELNADGDEDVDDVFEIIFHNIEHASIDAPRSFSRKTIVKAEDIKAVKNDSNLLVCYTDVDLKTPFKTTEGMTSDLDLYAEFGKFYLDFTFEDDEGTAQVTAQ